MSTPYSNAPARSFWRPAVAERHASDIAELWQPKFPIRADMKIATFGSCFAQHIGQALRSAAFAWLDTEPPPFGLSDENCKRFNHRLFSARTGNIYTTTMLRQWTDWALGTNPVPSEIWTSEGRFVDPFRPGIEPGGFATAEELRRAQLKTVAAFRQAIVRSDVFVFTLGLTERWVNVAAGYEYALCPGTAGGVFDPAQHRFAPLDFSQVFEALSGTMAAMRRLQPDLRFLLTVSPVPLTATMTGRHAILATTESKAILRAVAGQCAAERPYVDYFPSYEVITAAPFRAAFYDPNLRTVNASGVTQVMHHFFAGLATARDAPQHSGMAATGATDAARCDEALLDAFGPR